MEAKGGGQEWFYHAPSSRKKTEKQLVPPASQIPGLAALDEQDIEAMCRETGTNKSNWIRDTDSKYIQLAKKGGRKNLLSFNAQSKKSDGPQPYPRVDWFDHVPLTTEEEKKILAQRRWNPPEYMVHEPYIERQEKRNDPVKVDFRLAIKERQNIQQKYESRAAPFHSDDKSLWKRVDDEVNAPELLPESAEDRLKLPEISTNEKLGKRNEVDFSKLVSGGYGNEWIKQRSDAKHHNKAKGPPQKSWINFTEYQQAISKKEQPRQRLKPIVYQQRKGRKSVENKAPFKMSRFGNIKSKLSTGAVHS